MTSPANITDFQSAAYERLYAEYQSAHANTKQAWMAEVKAAIALKDSKTWKQYAATWQDYCSEELGLMPYRARTYSSYFAEIPLAAIIEATVATVVSPNDSRKIREKLSEIVDPEDKRLIPEVWALSYAYDESAIVPNANTIKAAYEVIKQERDNRSVSINGESFDVKALAQKMAVKEAVLENIQSHAGEKEKKTFKLERDSAGRFILCVPPDLQDRMPDAINVYLPVVTKVGE